MKKSRDRERPAPAPQNNNADKRRFIELNYRILECKILYYYEELIAPGYREALAVSDDEYDRMEMEYLKLCKKLGYPNTVVHKNYGKLGGGEETAMFEVDFTNGGVHMVLRKWGIKEWQKKCPLLDSQTARKIEAFDRKMVQ